MSFHRSHFIINQSLLATKINSIKCVMTSVETVTMKTYIITGPQKYTFRLVPSILKSMFMLQLKKMFPNPLTLSFATLLDVKYKLAIVSFLRQVCFGN